MQKAEQILSMGGFDYVPPIGLYVDRERTLSGKDLTQKQAELSGHSLRIITPNQFIKYLLWARASALDIYENITAVRDPLRGEKFDAHFEQRENGLYLLTNSKTEAELLDPDTLMEDRRSGISLEDWLSNPTKQGFPRKNVKEGNLYYWHPRAGKVARFVAGSGGIDFGWGWEPDVSDSWIGVRNVCDADHLRIYNKSDIMNALKEAEVSIELKRKILESLGR